MLALMSASLSYGYVEQSYCSAAFLTKEMMKLQMTKTD